MNDVFLGSVAAAPIIVAIIQVAKGLGFPVKYAVWLNAILAMIAYAIMLITEQNPDWMRPTQIALNFLITFLVTAGAYDIGKQVLPYRP